MNEQEIGHVYIPAHVMAREDINILQKMLYGKIVGLTGKDGFCFAGNEWLGKQLGKSHKTISKWISELVSLGLVRREVVRDEKGAIIKRKLFPLFNAQRGGMLEIEGRGIPEIEADIQDIYIQDNNISEKVNNSKKVEVSDKGIDNRVVNQNISQLFAFYLDAHGFNGNIKPKLTTARIAKFKTRLKTFSPDEIKQAIRNFMADTWKRERLGIDYIIRNDETLDSLLNANPLPKPKGNYLTDEEILARTV